MTEGILDLMNERKTFKTINPTKYKEINQDINKKIKEAKEKWLEENCKEMEDLIDKHDSKNFHKKVKELSGIKNKIQTNYLINDKKEIVTKLEDKKETWENYIKSYLRTPEETN